MKKILDVAYYKGITSALVDTLSRDYKVNVDTKELERVADDISSIKVVE